MIQLVKIVSFWRCLYCGKEAIRTLDTVNEQYTDAHVYVRQIKKLPNDWTKDYCDDCAKVVGAALQTRMK